jgi:hypothetical protein
MHFIRLRDVNSLSPARPKLSELADRVKTGADKTLAMDDARSPSS